MQMKKPANNSNSKTSKASGIPAGANELDAGRKKKAKTAKERRLAKAQAYFDDIRQQYADGQLSRRQIHAIDERIPGFFGPVTVTRTPPRTILVPVRTKVIAPAKTLLVRVRTRIAAPARTFLVAVRTKIVAPAVTGTIYTVKRRKGDKAA
jgi:hypothetical protein